MHVPAERCTGKQEANLPLDLAERRLGELLAQAKAAGGLNREANLRQNTELVSNEVGKTAPTLADAGISSSDGYPPGQTRTVLRRSFVTTTDKPQLWPVQAHVRRLGELLAGQGRRCPSASVRWWRRSWRT